MHDDLADEAKGGTKEQERYRRARSRVKALRGFYVHLTVYLLVNTGLIAINVLVQQGGWWWPWAAGGWGIGLAAHAVGVFVVPGFLGRDWEQRKIREIMAKDHDA